MRPITLPPEIQKELSRLKYVEGLLLTGSRVLGKAGKNADWDIHVLVAPGQPRWRKTYPVGDTWLELMCNDRDQVEKCFTEECRKGAEAHTVFMYASGQILKDNARRDLEKLVRRAKKLWEKGPGIPSKQRLSEINYAISTYLQDIEDCLEANNPAGLIFHQAVHSLVGYRFELAAEWIPRPKDRLEELRKIDRRFCMLVEAFLYESDWRRKAEMALNIGSDLGRKFQLPLDGSLFIPPKKR